MCSFFTITKAKHTTTSLKWRMWRINPTHLLNLYVQNKPHSSPQQIWDLDGFVKHINWLNGFRLACKLLDIHWEVSLQYDIHGELLWKLLHAYEYTLFMWGEKCRYSTIFRVSFCGNSYIYVYNYTLYFRGVRNVATIGYHGKLWISLEVACGIDKWTTQCSVELHSWASQAHVYLYNSTSSVA